MEAVGPLWVGVPGQPWLWVIAGYTYPLLSAAQVPADLTLEGWGAAGNRELGAECTTENSRMNERSGLRCLLL